MVRSPSYSNSGLKKGAWSLEEDNKLIAYIMRFGHWNWQLLPRFAGLARDGNSCRQRWINHLSPGIRRGPFSKEEEAILVRLHRDLGNRWSAIADKLPGRTVNQVRSFWNTCLRKKLENSFYPVEEIDSGLNRALHSRINVEPQQNEPESSSSVGNYSVIKRNSFFADQSQCSGDRDSDFTDVNTFIRILRGW